MSNGDGNTFIGKATGMNTNDDDAVFNTFIGKNAGYRNTEGSQNIIIGGGVTTWGGKFGTIGSKNTFIGVEASPSAFDSTHEIVIGCGAVGMGDKTTTIGSDNTEAAYIKALRREVTTITTGGTVTLEAKQSGGLIVTDNNTADQTIIMPAATADNVGVWFDFYDVKTGPVTMLWKAAGTDYITGKIEMSFPNSVTMSERVQCSQRNNPFTGVRVSSTNGQWAGSTHTWTCVAPGVWNVKGHITTDVNDNDTTAGTNLNAGNPKLPMWKQGL